MHPLDAKLTALQLQKLEVILNKRKRNTEKIIAALNRTSLSFSLQETKKHVFTKLSIIFKDQDNLRKLKKAFQDAGIETEAMYVPLHLRDFASGFFTPTRIALCRKSI